MKPKTIEIIIATDGGIKIDAVGFAGADCEQATAFLTQALGTVKTSTKKPDYYKRVHTGQHQRVGHDAHHSR